MVTSTPSSQPGQIRPIRIEDEMRTSYLSYAMSVIVSRALPDVRDGLKPVQRRILYAMHEMGIRPNTANKKSARIVGEVLGKFHPHGDSSVYDALVRMGQSFSLRYLLIDGQGNYGSVDGDPPAAMRYTEARLAPIAEELLADIDLNTVDVIANFDESLNEPRVLPSRLPNVLVNGASGIAVGMATNLPPHNLGEICDALCYLIDNPDCATEDLMELVPGPDFPTKGSIQGRAGIIDTYTTGRGRIVMQATTEIEETQGGRQQILITELPYQVNKANLVEKIAMLARSKKIDGISDIRDESDRQGMRIVVELRRDAQANITLNNLFRHTALRSSFNAIMLALVDGQPQVLPLKRTLSLFIGHRQIVIQRRSEFLLKRAQDRHHIVLGLLLALERLDEVIALIRGSDNVEVARTNLMERFQLTQPQTQAILDMQLRRLAALEREKLENENQELLNTIADLEALLASPEKVLATVKSETKKLKKEFGDPRRTTIYPDEVENMADEEYITHQDVVVTLSQRGYIKRVPSDTYRLQHRGGKGVRGMTTRDDDALLDLVVVDTHDTLFFFSNKGRVYPLRAYQIPGDTSRTARGTLLVNLISLAPGERVQAMLVFQKAQDDLMILATRHGEVKALRTAQLANIQARGLIVMDLEQGDELVSVGLMGESRDIILVSEKGQAICFPVSNLTPRSRAAGGVRGIRLLKGDRVISMGVVTPDGYLLVVSQGGYGKPTLLSRYPRQSRGGQGVLTFKVNSKTGRVAAARIVPATVGQEIFIISAKAQVVRITLADVRVTGRHTSGVIIWRDREPDDRVASIALIQDGNREKDEPNEKDKKTLDTAKPSSASLNGKPQGNKGVSSP
jgi:DNA gyrase subunit A